MKVCGLFVILRPQQRTCLAPKEELPTPGDVPARFGLGEFLPEELEVAVAEAARQVPEAAAMEVQVPEPAAIDNELGHAINPAVFCDIESRSKSCGPFGF